METTAVTLSAPKAFVLIKDADTIPGDSAQELAKAQKKFSKFAQQNGLQIEFADGRRLIGETDVFIREGDMAKRVAVLVKKDAQNYKTAINYFGHPEPFVQRVFQFLTTVATPRSKVKIHDEATLPKSSVKELTTAADKFEKFAKKHGMEIEFADGRRLMGESDALINQGEMAKKMAVFVKKGSKEYKTAITYAGNPEPFVKRVFKFLTLVAKR